MNNNNNSMLKPKVCILSFLLFLSFSLVGCTGKETAVHPTRTTLTSTKTASLSTKTMTPSATKSVVLPTETVTATLTIPRPTPIDTNVYQLLGRNSIAIVGVSEDKIHLVDLATGYIRSLPSPEYDTFQILSWNGNGCEILILAFQSLQLPDAVLRIDLEGNIIKDLSTFKQPTNIGNVTLSPSGEWIAYRVSEGSPIGGYDIIYEFENIEVRSIDGESGPYRLTHHNGGREVGWSPDSTRLAFGDFDENGFTQLYISNLDESGLVQLTQFDDPQVVIRDIQWSPDGKKIAFSYERQGNISLLQSRKTDVIILSTKAGQRSPVVGENIYEVATLWWQGTDVLVVYGSLDDFGTTSGSDDRLFWVDAQTGKIMSELKADNTPGGYMEITHPLGSQEKLGFFTGGRFYTYDIKTSSFVSWQNVNIRNNLGPFILRDWVYAPDPFKGEVACKP